MGNMKTSMEINIKRAKHVYLCVRLGRNPYSSDTAFVYTENLYFMFYKVSPLICALGRKKITHHYFV
jgi:hypothetical protein